MRKNFFSIRVKSFILFGFLIVFFLGFSFYALKLFREGVVVMMTGHHALMANLTDAGIKNPAQLNFYAEQTARAEQIMSFMVYLFIIFVVLAFLLLNYIIWRYIVHPIESLNIAVSRIAAGDYHQRIGERRRDEIGQLAASFNIMAEKLQKNHELTEKRIAERTADLEKLNKFLVGRELKMIELKKELYQREKNHENPQ